MPTEQAVPTAATAGTTESGSRVAGSAAADGTVREWGWANRIGFALASPVVATLIRCYLMAWMGTSAPLALYPVAILLSALFGGILCGAIATVLSGAIAWFVFFSATSPDTAMLRIFALALNGAVISVIGERIHVERRRRNFSDRALRSALVESGNARQALAMQARVLESMAEGVCVFREDGSILFTNPAFDQMFGAERSQLQGTNIVNLKDAPPDEARRRYASAVAEARRSNCWEGDQRHRNCCGEVFHTHTRITPIQLDQEWCYVSVHEDVSEKHRADEALHALNQDLRDRVQEMTTLLDVLPVGIGIATDGTADTS